VSFSYSTAIVSDLDKVRFYTGDTDSAAPIFSDEEITGALTIYGTSIQTAIGMADAMAAKYARRITMTIDGATFDYSNLAKQFAELGERLREQALEVAGALGAPFVGGVSIADIDNNDADTDRPPSRFKVGMDDAPSTGPASDPTL
jgi:hypothetical protein